MYKLSQLSILVSVALFAGTASAGEVALTPSKVVKPACSSGTPHITLKAPEEWSALQKAGGLTELQVCAVELEGNEWGVKARGRLGEQAAWIQLDPAELIVITKCRP